MSNLVDYPQKIHTGKRADNNLGDMVVYRTKNHEIENVIGDIPSERIRWARLQKGWMIKTLAAKAGITPNSLSVFENKASHSIDITTLRKLSISLEQPVWFLGCFEDMPEESFFQRLEKARFYHGHTKVEMAKDIGVNGRLIFNWKAKEPGPDIKAMVIPYFKILQLN